MIPDIRPSRLKFLLKVPIIMRRISVRKGDLLLKNTRGRGMAMINGISSAISALKAFERKLGIAANNLANIRTQGFKKSSSSSQEVSPQNMSTSSGVSQVGRGTTIGGITEDFSQGSFESTPYSTDMAIGGNGFFMVRAPEGGDYYTRDGQFHFDKNGRFVTTLGYALQGWRLDPITGETQGAIQDITLSSFTSSPQETTIIKNIINLNARAEDNSAPHMTLTFISIKDRPVLSGNTLLLHIRPRIEDRELQVITLVYWLEGPWCLTIQALLRI